MRIHTLVHTYLYNIFVSGLIKYPIVASGDKEVFVHVWKTFVVLWLHVKRIKESCLHETEAGKEFQSKDLSSQRPHLINTISKRMWLSLICLLVFTTN